MVYIVDTVLQNVTLNSTMISLDSGGTWRSHLPWLTGESAVPMPTVQILGEARTLSDAQSVQNRVMCDFYIYLHQHPFIYV